MISAGHGLFLAGADERLDHLAFAGTVFPGTKILSLWEISYRSVNWGDVWVDGSIVIEQSDLGSTGANGSRWRSFHAPARLAGCGNNPNNMSKSAFVQYAIWESKGSSMTNPFGKIKESFIIPANCRERFLPVRKPYSRPLQQRGFIYAGISELWPPYEIGRPDFGEQVVLFILGGRGWWQTKDVAGEMLPGETWFFPARVPYRYQAAPEGWQMAWVHFHEANPAGYTMPAAVSRRTDMDFSSFVNLADLYIQEAFRQDPDPAAAAALAELVGIHFDRLLRPPSDARRTAERKRLDELWQEVDGRLAHPWNVTELAQRFCLSPGQFRRVMLEHERMPPLQKLTDLRLARARELLLGTDYSLARIAALVGYDSPYSFSRVFRRLMGTSPGAFRRH